MKKDPFRYSSTGRIQGKNRRKWYYIVFLTLAPIVVFCTVYALILPAITMVDVDRDAGNSPVLADEENSETENISTLESFYLWLYVIDDGTAQQVYANPVWDNGFVGSGIGDALEYTDDGGAVYYLIPVRYFTEYLGAYGYSFDATDPGDCVIWYAPDAGYSTSNLENAGYRKVNGSYYVQVRDATKLGTGDPHRSNLYFTVPAKTVPGVSHASTVINLFDYWTTGQYDADNVNALNSGVNENHELKFRSANTNALFNQWTKSENVLPGIVANTLGEDGYPYLSGDTKLGITADNFESLAYLFDPTLPADYKATHRNVGGLLQIDSTGYYYYNSQENYAEYDETANRFILYEDWGVYAGGSSPNGQFFPFNSYEEVKSIDSTGLAINHYFGMTLATRFVQRYDG